MLQGIQRDWRGWPLAVAASVYMAALCLLNTLRGGGAPLISIVDGALILSALALALHGQAPRLLLPLMLLALNVLLLGVLAGGVNVKAARDLLAPLAFLALGWRYGGLEGAKIAFFIVSALVVALGLFEYLFTAEYVRYFNVLQFYIDRGVVDAQQAQYVDNSLFVSGTRGAQRALFPLLGQHRVASIFLEPVSMGNFGAIAAAWALSLNDKRAACFAALVAAFAIIMADARFGAISIAFFILARWLVVPRWNHVVIALAPVAVIVVLLIMGGMGFGDGDDLPTRLALSGRALASMSAADLFGIGAGPLATQDSGYYYAFKSFGLVFCALAWLGFAAAPAPGRQSQRFKLFLGIYMALILSVSGTSLFALKTAGLSFFLFGALAAAEGFPNTVRSRLAVRRVHSPAVTA